MKAWMVSSGEYSAYEVGAVFTSRLAAETTVVNANKRLSKYEALTVEEVDLYDAPVEGAVVRDRRGVVRLDGKVEGRENSDTFLMPWDGYYVGPRPRVRTWQQFRDGDPFGFLVSVVGSDFTAVAKAFGDRVAQLKAQPEVTWEALEAERQANR